MPSRPYTPPTPTQISAAVTLVQQALTPDLLDTKYRPRWTPENPTYGHCATASEAVYFLLGGPNAGLTAWVARDTDGTTHWWLQTADGQRIDPTADQYTSVGRLPPYERGILGKPCGFMGQRKDPLSPYGFGRRPGGRAAIVLERIDARLDHASEATNDQEGPEFRR
jgi:hypothetical protein